MLTQKYHKSSQANLTHQKGITVAVEYVNKEVKHFGPILLTSLRYQFAPFVKVLIMLIIVIFF